MVEETVRSWFDGAADTYSQSRPDYPDSAITALIGGLELKPGAHAIDLGAGTGIFSQRIAAHGLVVTAVEPVGAMRAKITESARVRPHDAQAEATGLPGACADAVVAATAWHWFDPERTIAEVRRVLKPDPGGLGLLWNLYDESVAWVAEFADISGRRRPAHSPSATSGVWRAFFDELPGWEPLHEVHLPNPQTTSPEQLIGRLMSSSAITNLPATERENVRAEAHDVFRRHDLTGEAPISLPYITSVYWTKPTATQGRSRSR